MDDQASVLKTACDAVLTDQTLQPVKDASGNIIETHCNIGAARIAASMDCKELSGPDGKALMADAQHAVMDANASGRWEKVNGSEAAAWALTGGLAFASASSNMLHEAHGHIAAVYPATTQFSGSLNKLVPIVANVGKEDRMEKESLAFPVADGEPDYFTYA